MPPSAFFTTLRDGLPVKVRPITPQDRETIRKAFNLLSEESRYHRFWIRAKQVNPGLIDRLADTNATDHIAWIVVPVEGTDPPGYGGASFWRSTTQPDTAEFSITVADAWQDLGVGTLLLALLWHHARLLSIQRLIAHVLPSNFPMRSWMESLGAGAVQHDRQWIFTLDLDVAQLNESSASERLKHQLESLPSFGTL